MGYCTSLVVAGVHVLDSTMRRKAFFALTSVTLLLMLAATFLDPYRRLLGLTFGEPFCQGYPASYWAEQFEQEARSGALKPSTVEAFNVDLDSVPVLLHCTASPSFEVRWAATRLLQRFGSFGEQVSTFSKLLDDPETRVQVEAIHGLGMLGREARPALTQLEELSHSGDDEVSLAARYALWSIDRRWAIRAEDWQENQVPRLGFEAQFPGNIHTDSRKAKLIDSDLHECWATLGPWRFSVVITNLLPDASTTLGERYARRATWVADKVGGTLESSDEITQGSLVGRDQRITIKDRFVMRTRLFIVKDRVYQAQVVHKRGALHPDAVEHFLNSFRIIEQSAER